MVRALHFYRENISALSSLVDSRRIVPTDERCSQQLSLIFTHNIQSINTYGFELWAGHY